jgi:hypothetical protein
MFSSRIKNHTDQFSSPSKTNLNDDKDSIRTFSPSQLVISHESEKKTSKTQFIVPPTNSLYSPRYQSNKGDSTKEQHKNTSVVNKSSGKGLVARIREQKAEEIKKAREERREINKARHLANAPKVLLNRTEEIKKIPKEFDVQISLNMLEIKLTDDDCYGDDIKIEKEKKKKRLSQVQLFKDHTNSHLLKRSVSVDYVQKKFEKKDKKMIFTKEEIDNNDKLPFLPHDKSPKQKKPSSAPPKNISHSYTLSSPLPSIDNLSPISSVPTYKASNSLNSNKINEIRSVQLNSLQKRRFKTPTFSSSLTAGYAQPTFGNTISRVEHLKEFKRTQELRKEENAKNKGLKNMIKLKKKKPDIGLTKEELTDIALAKEDAVVKARGDKYNVESVIIDQSFILRDPFIDGNENHIDIDKIPFNPEQLGDIALNAYRGVTPLYPFTLPSHTKDEYGNPLSDEDGPEFTPEQLKEAALEQKELIKVSNPNILKKKFFFFYCLYIYLFVFCIIIFN